jgi:hypothetical protein
VYYSRGEALARGQYHSLAVAACYLMCSGSLGHSDLTQLAFWQLLRDPAAPVASDGATKVAQSEHTRGSHIPY